jgi:pimeloyl-ACP methyl ester carboxylesterase
MQGFIAHSFGGLAIALALEALPHDINTKVALIAPATETTTAIESAFNILGIKNEKLKRSLKQVIFEESGKAPAWFSIRRAMNNIKATVLWCHDENDDVTPLADALKVKEDNHPNIRFYITKGLGHRRIYRDAEVKKKIVEFL